MKKNLLVTLFAALVAGGLLVTQSAFAEQATPDNRFGLGLSLHSGSDEYTGYDTGAGNLFVVYHGDRITVDDGLLAFNFTPDSALDVEAALVRQHFGYESDDANVLRGLEDRHQIWGAGARVTLPTEIGRFRSGIYFNPIDDDDVKDAESGSSVNLEYAFPVQAGRFEISPVAGVQWISEEVTDFLYGVSAPEATASRAAFKGEDATIGYLGVEAAGMVTDNVRLTGGLRFESLPDEIADSPLVEDDAVTRAYLGVAWMF